MTAIEYIESLDKADFRIERCRDKIERLETLAENRSSKPFDNDRVMSSGSKDRIGDLTCKIMSEREKCDKMEREREEKLDYINGLIDGMKNTEHAKIIYYIHVRKESYTDVADMLDKEVQTIRNMHSKAIKELEKSFYLP